MQQKILILKSIPHGLDLDKEINEIVECIQRTAKRDKFEIRLRAAIRPQDIRRALAEVKPHIVHFCGHGLEDGSLLLEDNTGDDKPVKPEALAQLFELHTNYVQCVVINACHSVKSAIAINQYIKYTIGMNQQIQDKAAIAFSQGFYDALGYDFSDNLDNLDIFKRAFREGLVAIQLEDFSQSEIPVLKINKQLVQTITEIPENPSESNFPNQQITITPENGNNLPKIPRWRNIFLRFVGKGLSIKKAFILSLVVTSGIVGLRFFAVFEWLELKTFDHLMQTRFIYEKKDNRLLIVAVTDDDIKAQDERGELGYGNSLRDPSLDKLLTILQQHKPRVIGLDFYRPKPVVDKNKTPTLVNNLQQNNIVTVCKAPDTDEEGDRISPEVPPPPEIKSSKIPEKVGFTDFITDYYIDDHLRRHLMAQDIIPGTECRTKQSFSLLLARRYLEQESEGKQKYKITIKSGEYPRIGDVIFPTVEFFTGGYQGIDFSGFQVLLNYRATTSGKVADVKTLEDILNNKFNPQDIKDKIILIGSYAEQEGPSDKLNTPYGIMNGVTVHAQMVSQILSTVLDGRSLLHVWPQGIEIIWIGTWSFFGGFLVCYLRPLKIIGFAMLISILILYITCLTTLTINSLWIPFIPALLGLTITSGAFFIIK